MKGANNTLIGSAAVAASDNFISNNFLTGIFVGDAGSSAIIVNNTIGLLPTGVSAANSFGGVQVTSGATATIGGAGANQGNVISGNISSGISYRFDNFGCIDSGQHHRVGSHGYPGQIEFNWNRRH